MADHKDIAKLVALLSAAYPNWNLSEYTIEVYYLDLRDIPADELMIAAQHCRSEAGRKFAPSVGELRGAVMELRHSAMNIPSAFDAWQDVLMQFVNTGSYGTPQFTSPITARVVKSLGWRNLCLSENQAADRARFLQAFEQMSERAEKEMMLIPEVRNYLESNGAQLLSAPVQVKQLAEGMTKK